MCARTAPFSPSPEPHKEDAPILLLLGGDHTNEWGINHPGLPHGCFSFVSGSDFQQGWVLIKPLLMSGAWKAPPGSSWLFLAPPGSSWRDPGRAIPRKRNCHMLPYLSTLPLAMREFPMAETSLFVRSFWFILLHWSMSFIDVMCPRQVPAEPLRFQEWHTCCVVLVSLHASDRGHPVVQGQSLLYFRGHLSFPH
jgi:hypothetical protein